MLKLLYSVPIAGSESYLGLWAGVDYVPRSATEPKARGRVQLRIQSIPSGGVHQRKLWPRRTVRAEAAIEFADLVKAEVFEQFTFESFVKWSETTLRNWLAATPRV